MNKHILVIGGNDSSAVKAARTGVDVTLFQLRRLLTNEQMDAAARLFIFDFEDIPAALQLARAVHAIQPLDAVVSFWERALLPAAIIGEFLGIPANPSRAVQVTRDKAAMREVLAANGMNGVRFRRGHSRRDASGFMTETAAPIIVKPTDGSGSAGVSLVVSEDQIDAAWQWATQAGAREVLVEEYVDGEEYSIESLSLNGTHRILGITEKFTTGAPHFIETGHRFPADLRPDVAGNIERTVVRLLTEVGHRDGPAHTEVRLRNGKPVIIETQTRFGGDQIWEMVELVTGIDLTASTCAQLLGLAPPPAGPRSGGAAIRFFAYENGTVADVTGIDDAR